MMIYLAAPLKTDEQRTRNMGIAHIIRQHYKGGTNSQMRIYLPQHYMVLKPNATREERRGVYFENLKRIEQSELVVAVLDEKDTGVIFEMGFRACTKRPLIAVYLIPSAVVNVMLTEGCYAVCNGEDEFKGWLQNPRPVHYSGGTE